jgi:hypothetical protein
MTDEKLIVLSYLEITSCNNNKLESNIVEIRKAVEDNAAITKDDCKLNIQWKPYCLFYLVITYRSERINTILYYNFIYSFTSISNPSNHPLSEAWLSKDWGTAHSCYGSNRSRATWDPAELDYIRKEVSTIESKGVVPALIQRIREDENAVPIFLLRHIINAGRLSHGYKQMLKLEWCQ